MKLAVIEDSRGVFVRDLDAGENVAMLCGHDANPAKERELGVLFAAAPELVECVRDWVEYMKNNGGDRDNADWDKARTALQKAGVTV